jgi:hypothetical protein
MSFIADLQRQRNNSAASPVVVPQTRLQGATMDGLAATFRDPNRFNVPMNSQFAIPNPALARNSLERNYRG